MQVQTEVVISVVVLVCIPQAEDPAEEPTSHDVVMSRVKVPHARDVREIVSAEVNVSKCGFAILQVGTTCSACDSRDKK